MSILICPLLLVAVATMVRQPRLLTRIAAALMIEQLVVVSLLYGPWLGVPQARALVVGGFRLDGVTAFFLLLTTLVAAAALTHAVGFFDRELAGPHPPTGWGVAQLYLFTALFLLAGNVLQDFGTKRIRGLHGLLSAQPLQGTLALLAAFAVAGTPPFGSFLAEWRILQDTVDLRQFLVAAVVVVALATAFIAVSLQMGSVLMGAPPKRAVAGGWRSAAVPLALLAAALLLGLALPSQAMEMVR